jgi:hypothetical protein
MDLQEPLRDDFGWPRSGSRFESRGSTQIRAGLLYGEDQDETFAPPTTSVTSGFIPADLGVIGLDVVGPVVKHDLGPSVYEAVAVKVLFAYQQINVPTVEDKFFADPSHHSFGPLVRVPPQRGWSGYNRSVFDLVQNSGALDDLLSRLQSQKNQPATNTANDLAPDRQAAVLVRAFLRLAERWGLSDNEAAILLGHPDTGFIQDLKKNRSPVFLPDQLDRLRYVLDIYSTVNRLVQDPNAERLWIRQSWPRLENMSVLEVMLRGHMVDLIITYEFVEDYAGR